MGRDAGPSRVESKLEIEDVHVGFARDVDDLHGPFAALGSRQGVAGVALQLAHALGGREKSGIEAEHDVATVLIHVDNVPGRLQLGLSVTDAGVCKAVTHVGLVLGYSRR